MRRNSLILVNAAVLSLIGCGGGSSDGATGESTQGVTVVPAQTTTNEIGVLPDSTDSTLPANGTESSAVDEVTTDSNAMSAVGNSAEVGGASMGANPETVPDATVSEVASIDLAAYVGPAGYKIYAGDVIDPELPTDLAEVVKNNYLYLEFPCHGATGNIDVVPRTLSGVSVEPYGGTFSWETADPQDEFGIVDLAIESINYGSQDNIGTTFVIDNVVNGTLSVGSGLLDELVVTRIIQMDTCS